MAEHRNEVSSQEASAFTNPILPGWHSDPTCIFVPEWDNTFFCTTSSFLAFPGLPIYASKDLRNWRLVSNAFNRQSQVPQVGVEYGQNNGLFAPSLRFYKGTFHIIVEYVAVKASGPPDVFGLVFTSKNPYEASSWGDPVVFTAPDHILDPDLFWDTDGTLYVQAGSFRQHIVQFHLDLETGITSPPQVIWKGTGQTAPEGPHMYKKDGWYYLLISEGGTELSHCLTIARSKSPCGPFQGFAYNPILTNRDTKEYFQTVGHADLFQDASGHWWGVALATRSGPEYIHYPMGRETVLFPVTWDQDEWPRLEPVRGRMTGWPLPSPNRDIPGSGSFSGDSEVVDFPPGSELPPHFVHWRFPAPDSFAVSPSNHPNSLRILPSKSNLTGATGLSLTDGMAFVARRQTSTAFNFSVDVSFQPVTQGEETGVTVFLTQLQHISLGIVLLPIEMSSTSAQASIKTMKPYLRFQVVEPDKVTRVEVSSVPDSWVDRPISLHIQGTKELEYIFSARLADYTSHDVIQMGRASSSVVSGGTGHWTGSLVGAYSTSNGGAGTTAAYLSRWTYEVQGQYIGGGEWV